MVLCHNLSLKKKIPRSPVWWSIRPLKLGFIPEELSVLKRTKVWGSQGIKENPQENEKETWPISEAGTDQLDVQEYVWLGQFVAVWR